MSALRSFQIVTRIDISMRREDDILESWPQTVLFQEKRSTASRIVKPVSWTLDPGSRNVYFEKYCTKNRNFHALCP